MNNFNCLSRILTYKTDYLKLATAIVEVHPHIVPCITLLTVTADLEAGLITSSVTNEFINTNCAEKT